MIATKALLSMLFPAVLFLACAGCSAADAPAVPTTGSERGGESPSSSPSSGGPASDDATGSSSGDPSTAGNAGAPAASGCGKSGGLGAGNTDVTITSGGRSRTARVHVPKSYDPTKPTAIVLNYHGRMSTASDQETLSQATAKADAAGFIVVYPTGVGETWNAGLCCGEAQSAKVDDVGFTRDLLDDLSKKLCVDSKRVFAMGLSNGAFMSNRLACDLSDRIAAIGPVAGQLMMLSCKPSRPVPVMYFHGDDDQVVSYDGMYGMPSAVDSAKAWATRNGCNATPKQTYAKGDATCVTYSGCTANADVTFCTIAKGGHTWPGGPAFLPLGNTSKDIDATSELWKFFSAHPMP